MRHAAFLYPRERRFQESVPHAKKAGTPRHQDEGDCLRLSLDTAAYGPALSGIGIEGCCVKAETECGPERDTIRESKPAAHAECRQSCVRCVPDEGDTASSPPP